MRIEEALRMRWCALQPLLGSRDGVSHTHHYLMQILCQQRLFITCCFVNNKNFSVFGGGLLFPKRNQGGRGEFLLFNL